MPGFHYVLVTYEKDWLGLLASKRELAMDCPWEEEGGGTGSVSIRVTRCLEGLGILCKLPGVGHAASTVNVINAVTPTGLKWSRNHVQERRCLGRGFPFHLLLLIFQASVPPTVCTPPRARPSIRAGF